MKIIQYYADELDKCPECGGTDFYELWSGDDEDAELEGLVCKKCCKSYPTKKNYLRHQRKIDKNFGNYNIPY
jgi:formate dehydrogenase maturation protein FdhE